MGMGNSGGGGGGFLTTSKSHTGLNIRQLSAASLRLEGSTGQTSTSGSHSQHQSHSQAQMQQQEQQKQPSSKLSRQLSAMSLREHNKKLEINAGADGGSGGKTLSKSKSNLNSQGSNTTGERNLKRHATISNHGTSKNNATSTNSVSGVLSPNGLLSHQDMSQNVIISTKSIEHSVQSPSGSPIMFRRSPDQMIPLEENATTSIDHLGKGVGENRMNSVKKDEYTSSPLGSNVMNAFSSISDNSNTTEGRNLVQNSGTEVNQSPSAIVKLAAPTNADQDSVVPSSTPNQQSYDQVGGTPSRINVFTKFLSNMVVSPTTNFMSVPRAASTSEMFSTSVRSLPVIPDEESEPEDHPKFELKSKHISLKNEASPSKGSGVSNGSDIFNLAKYSNPKIHQFFKEVIAAGAGNHGEDDTGSKCTSYLLESPLESEDNIEGPVGQEIHQEPEQKTLGMFNRKVAGNTSFGSLRSNGNILLSDDENGPTIGDSKRTEAGDDKKYSLGKITTSHTKTGASSHMVLQSDTTNDLITSVSAAVAKDTSASKMTSTLTTEHSAKEESAAHSSNMLTSQIRRGTIFLGNMIFGSIFSLSAEDDPIKSEEEAQREWKKAHHDAVQEIGVAAAITIVTDNLHGIADPWTLSFYDRELEESYRSFFAAMYMPNWRRGIVLQVAFFFCLFIYHMVAYPSDSSWYETLVAQRALSFPNVTDYTSISCTPGFECELCSNGHLCNYFSYLDESLFMGVGSILSGMLLYTLSFQLGPHGRWHQWTHLVAVFYMVFLIAIPISTHHFVIEPTITPYKTGLLYIFASFTFGILLRPRFLHTLVASPMILFVFVTEAIMAAKKHNMDTTSLGISSLAVFYTLCILCYILYHLEYDARSQFYRSTCMMKDNVKLQDQLKDMHRNYADKVLDFDSPLEKAMGMLTLMRMDPFLHNSHFESLGMVLALLNSKDLMTPDIQQQVYDGAVGLDEEGEVGVYGRTSFVVCNFF
jgi:hypothetical protein